jgi:hypothetical protein
MQQGTDLITQLAQIRQRQGLEPLPNPGFIPGFGENDPPGPPPPPLYSPQAEDDDEIPPPAQQYYVKKQEPQTPALSEEMMIPQFKLTVMDSMAQYAGHAVVLEDSERDQVATIVITAIKRELDQLGSNLQKPGTAFTYAELESATTAMVPAKRKRGRPRKVQT